MSIQEVKAEVETWSAAARRDLAAHLTILRLREDKAWARRMTEMLNDKREGQWISMEEADRRLGLK